MKMVLHKTVGYLVIVPGNSPKATEQIRSKFQELGMFVDVVPFLGIDRIYVVEILG
jgi:hypothetical protein